MCRRELEANQRENVLEILANTQVLHLALSGDYCPYVVPVNYGYDWQERNLLFYIYGVKQGKRISLLERNQKIGFELDCTQVPVMTKQYNNVVGQGSTSMLSDLKEKKHALLRIMEHETGKYMYEIPDSKIKNTEIIKIEVISMTMKQKK